MHVSALNNHTGFSEGLNLCPKLTHYPPLGPLEVNNFNQLMSYSFAIKIGNKEFYITLKEYFKRLFTFFGREFHVEICGSAVLKILALIYFLKQREEPLTENQLADLMKEINKILLDLDVRIIDPGFNFAKRNEILERFHLFLAGLAKDNTSLSEDELITIIKKEGYTFQPANIKDDVLNNHYLITAVGKKGVFAVEISWVQKLGMQELFRKEGIRIKVPPEYFFDPSFADKIEVISDLPLMLPFEDRVNKNLVISNYLFCNKRSWGRMLLEELKGYKPEDRLMCQSLFTKAKKYHNQSSEYIAELLKHAYENHLPKAPLLVYLQAFTHLSRDEIAGIRKLIPPFNYDEPIFHCLHALLKDPSVDMELIWDLIRCYNKGSKKQLSSGPYTFLLEGIPKTFPALKDHPEVSYIVAWGSYFFDPSSKRLENVIELSFKFYSLLEGVNYLSFTVPGMERVQTLDDLATALSRYPQWDKLLMSKMKDAATLIKIMSRSLSAALNFYEEYRSFFKPKERGQIAHLVLILSANRNYLIKKWIAVIKEEENYLQERILLNSLIPFAKELGELYFCEKAARQDLKKWLENIPSQNEEGLKSFASSTLFSLIELDPRPVFFKILALRETPGLGFITIIQKCLMPEDLGYTTTVKIVELFVIDANSGQICFDHPVPEKIIRSYLLFLKEKDLFFSFAGVLLDLKLISEEETLLIILIEAMNKNKVAILEKMFSFALTTSLRNQFILKALSIDELKERAKHEKIEGNDSEKITTVKGFIQNRDFSSAVLLFCLYPSVWKLCESVFYEGIKDTGSIVDVDSFLVERLEESPPIESKFWNSIITRIEKSKFNSLKVKVIVAYLKHRKSNKFDAAACRLGLSLPNLNDIFPLVPFMRNEQKITLLVRMLNEKEIDPLIQAAAPYFLPFDSQILECLWGQILLKSTNPVSGRSILCKYPDYEIPFESRNKDILSIDFMDERISWITRKKEPSELELKVFFEFLIAHEQWDFIFKLIEINFFDPLKKAIDKNALFDRLFLKLPRSHLTRAFELSFFRDYIKITSHKGYLLLIEEIQTTNHLNFLLNLPPIKYKDSDRIFRPKAIITLYKKLFATHEDQATCLLKVIGEELEKIPPDLKIELFPSFFIYEDALSYNYYLIVLTSLIRKTNEWILEKPEFIRFLFIYGTTFNQITHFEDLFQEFFKIALKTKAPNTLDEDLQSYYHFSSEQYQTKKVIYFKCLSENLKVHNAFDEVMLIVIKQILKYGLGISSFNHYLLDFAQKNLLFAPDSRFQKSDKVLSEYQETFPLLIDYRPDLPELFDFHLNIQKVIINKWIEKKFLNRERLLSLAFFAGINSQDLPKNFNINQIHKSILDLIIILLQSPQVKTQERLFALRRSVEYLTLFLPLKSEETMLKRRRAIDLVFNFLKTSPDMLLKSGISFEKFFQILFPPLSQPLDKDSKEHFFDIALQFCSFIVELKLEDNKVDIVDYFIKICMHVVDNKICPEYKELVFVNILRELCNYVIVKSSLNQNPGYLLKETNLVNMLIKFEFHDLLVYWMNSLSKLKKDQAVKSMEIVIKLITAKNLKIAEIPLNMCLNIYNHHKNQLNF